MGLDMYLVGDHFRHERKKKIEGFEVKSELLEIGYWRKHPDLHGFIVSNFAESKKDDCEKIWLGDEYINTILKAIADDALNHNTKGFFFGKSYQPGESDDWGNYKEQKDRDIKIFTDALAWLRKDKKGVWKDVYYEASW